MFLTENKLRSRVDELKNHRYRNSFSLESFRCLEDTQGVSNPVIPLLSEEWSAISVGDIWKGRDRYLWLQKKVTIPQSFAGEQIVGIFDFGNTGGGNNSGFESLLYVDGTPYQGVDANHKEVFFPAAYVGKTITLTFRLWSGLEGGGLPSEQVHRISQASLACLDQKTDDFYYLADTVIETVRVLPDDSADKHNLKTALNRAINLIDWSYPDSEAFYASIAQADDLLNEEVNAMQKNSLVRVTCVGHTHIDLAWLWRLKHTREKASRSFSTVLRLMERYPEYIFLQTQPQIYEYIKEDFPEIFAQIKEKVASGQWEADGGMWVEADCNLTSGESLTRQILIGSSFIRQEFGREVNYLWLPDVFGYSWALPQILKKSGIDTFMTTKISWNQYNRMPHDTFYWTGIDGSQVLTHFITTPEPWCQPGSWFYTYNGQLLPKTVKGVWDAYSEKDMNKELLISYGYGDGGGGVSRDMLEQRRRLDKMPGLPSVKTGTAKEYFRNLHETIDSTDQYVNTWDGELYLEYHRGTYTSHAYNKKMNRKMEFLYREAEFLTAMHSITAGNLNLARQEDLTKGWKILLANQFHDIIPGSSIHEVYEDCIVDYTKAEQIARNVEEETFSDWMRPVEQTFTVWNNAAWTRTGLVCLPVTEDGTFLDTKGNSLHTQKTEHGTYVEITVPSMGYETIAFEPGCQAEAEAFRLDGSILETPFYHIEWNEQGQLTSLYDKEAKRQVLAPGQRGNVLQVFEDKPLGNDAWDIDIFYQEKMREVTDLQSVKLAENGALRAVVRMEWKYMNSLIRQDMIVYAKDRRIDFKTWADYHEVHQLLKVCFPVDIRTTYATYDIQYGNVRRSNHWNTRWDQAKFETVGHRFADLSERDYGVSLMNDCKYGYDVKENRLRLTLIKTAGYPDHSQDLGEHEFTYSLLPHKGDFVDGHTVLEAYDLNQPLISRNGCMPDCSHSFITVNNPYVELDAVKQSEDKNDLVIRFHEFSGSRQQVALELGFDYTSWCESDLMERPVEEFRTVTEGEKICLEVRPYEIKTILVKL